MRKSTLVIFLIALSFLLLVLDNYGIIRAQEPKTITIFDQPISRFRVAMPEKADVMKFPSLPDGTSRVGYGGVIVESGMIKGRAERHIIPFSDKVTEYLTNKKGVLDIGEVYRQDSALYYEMPRIAVYANDKSPLTLEEVELNLGRELSNDTLGKELTSHLVKAGKIKEGKLLEIVVFCSFKFVKRSDGAFVIISWLPDFSLQQLIEN
jgi:hypothetical protein